MRLPAAALLVADKLPDNDPLKKVALEYKTKFEKETGQPVSTFGGHMRDGLMILVEAMKRAKSADKAKVRDEIEKTKGFVGTGGIVNMSPTDHLGPRSDLVPHARDQERRLDAGELIAPFGDERFA